MATDPSQCNFEAKNLVLQLRVTLAADRTAIDPVVQNVMSLVNVSAQSQIVVTGVLLVISVLGPRVVRQIATARARRRSAIAISTTGTVAPAD